MEFILVSAIAGLGFILSKNNNPRQTKINYLSEMNPNYKPSGINIYENRRSQDVWNEQQTRANHVFSKSKNSLKTNYMIAGPPVPIFNKIDGTDNTLPVEFIGANGLKQKAEEINNELSKKKYDSQFNRPVNDLEAPTLYKDYAASGGWDGISLTGNPVDRQSFFHNNMVPFFGGTAKQNVEDTANQTLLETFTGSDSTYQSKVELKRDDLFQPVANLANINGMKNLDGYSLDRYIVGNIRNNQSPIEPIRVGPGLNQGFTSDGSGGYQQANTLDFIQPKTVDELRVKTKPKVSYEGVVIPGSGVSKPGKVGVVSKNQPDRFYVNSPDRLFTTVGSTTGPAQRAAIDVKFTNRKTTGLTTRVGSAYPAATGSRQQLKPSFQKSSRINHSGSGPRNYNSQGQWGIEGKELPNDYGRTGFKARPNMRVVSGPKMQITNMSMPNKNNQAPHNPNIKHTRKNNVVGNNRWSGNFQNTGPNKGTVYDPNDVMRTTIKEQQIDNNHSGYFENTGPTKGTVYDPNDIMRTTIKEQHIDNNHIGYFQNTGPNRATIYDPTNVMKPTIKHSTMVRDNVGNVQNQTAGGGYKNIKMKAKDTQRLTTSVHYIGDAKGQSYGGYQNTNVKAKNTERQFHTGEVKGNAGPASVKAQMSHDNIENLSIKTIREKIAVGRKPAHTGPTQIYSKDDINMKTNRTGDIGNEYIENRGVVSTKTYNSMPQRNQFGETHYKDTLPNKPIADRINPEILDAFRKNPYTQSLHSYVFQ